MAVRRWQVRPDVGVPVDDGMIGAVSRESFVDAVLDGVAMLDRSGGMLQIVVGREPTDLPGEMVTNGVVIEWRDRTDAKAAPEQPTEVIAREDPDPEPEVLEEQLKVEIESDGPELPVPEGAR
jgi:hypothetical protein